jgi:hypothetical protein
MKALVAAVSGLVLLAHPVTANDGSAELAQVFAPRFWPEVDDNRFDGNPLLLMAQ